MSSTGIALGMADQAMEAFLGSIERRSVPYSPYARQVEAPVAHHIIGRAAMQIRAAGRLADAAVAEFDRLDAAGVDPTEQEILQFHTDAAYIWNECATAIETLFRASGRIRHQQADAAATDSSQLPGRKPARSKQRGHLDGEPRPVDGRGRRGSIVDERARAPLLTPSTHNTGQ